MVLFPIFIDRFKDSGASKSQYIILTNKVSAFCTAMLECSNEVFDECAKMQSGKETHADSVQFAFARHNIVYMDCIRVLLSAGCVEGCEPLMRSILEATLNILHISEAKHEERAKAYKVSILMAQVNKLRKGDISTPKGKDFDAELADDNYLQGILRTLPSDLGSRADALEQSLRNDPDFAPTLAEWKLFKKPKWYTLYSCTKPSTTLRDLGFVTH